ncbi:unnamed protein product [Caenorhabditis brenneri]
MHPRKDLAIFIAFCMLDSVFVHVPMIAFYSNFPLTDYIDCTQFCLVMDYFYAGFQLILAVLNLVVTPVLLHVIDMIRTQSIKWPLRLILALKALVILFSCVSSFSVELAHQPALEPLFICAYTVVRVHIIMEILVALYGIWMVTFLENGNILKIRVPMKSFFRTYSSNSLIYVPAPKNEVTEPRSQEPKPQETQSQEAQPHDSDKLSDQEKFLCDFIISMNKALAAYEEKNAVTTSHPPIKFEDYE